MASARSATPRATAGLAPPSGQDMARRHPPAGAGGTNLNGYCDRAFRDCGCGDHHGMGMARRDGPNAAVPVDAGRETLLRLVCPVPRPSDPYWPGYPGRSPANRRGSGSTQANHGLRAHLLGGSRARPDPRTRQTPWHEGVAGLVAVEQAGTQPQTGRDHDRPGQAVSRCDCGGHRRQRSLAAGGDVGARSHSNHPRGQGAGLDAGHLCRCVGVLVTPSRHRRRRRFRDHPHPALLGGLSDSGTGCGRARRCHSQAGGRRLSGQGCIRGGIRLAERGPHA